MKPIPSARAWSKQIASSYRHCRPVLGACAVSLWLLLAGTTPAHAQPAELFEPLTRTQQARPNPLQARQVAKIKRRPTTAGVVLAKINVEMLGANIVRMTLTPRKALVFTKTEVETRAPGDFTWYGKVNDGPGTAILVVRDGKITGTIRDNGALYRVESVGNGVHAVIEVNSDRFPADHGPGRPAENSGGRPPLLADPKRSPKRTNRFPTAKFTSR
jgi:hypothetical protein